METFWFAAVAWMFAMYVVFDGFDLGAGICHLFVAKTEGERAAVIRSIGPVWDGNEVWLVAGGGVLFFAFPKFYASSFSGFYLPFMMVLWLLVLRAIAIEFRDHYAAEAVRRVFDVVFALASTGLALLFGVALGNIVRGVPLDGDGSFFVPLWTDFSVRGRVGAIDPYTLFVGVVAVASLAMHGARWIAYRSALLGDDGARVLERARRFTRVAFMPMILSVAVLTAVTWIVQPNLGARIAATPIGLVLPAIAIAGLFASHVFGQRRQDGRAFLASAFYVFGMFTSAAFGIFPYVLPSSIEPGSGLTAAECAAGSYALRTGLAWWIPGMLLVSAYFVVMYRFAHGHGRDPASDTHTASESS